MKVLVTGAAGFIGSHLTEALTHSGVDVIAIDSLSDYYSVEAKQQNVQQLRDAGVQLITTSLTDMDLNRLLDQVDLVYHLAAQPGVRLSWTAFKAYLRDNLEATQRLLQSCVECNCGRIVIASSSSVYGNSATYPSTETDTLRPFSPYGVTKRAVEDLSQAYFDNYGVSSVLLRYFTVYGPRQRPDMAFHRMFEAVLGGPRFPLYGTGSSTRDFTYVGDAVTATLAAGEADIDGSVALNIAGSEQASVSDVLSLIADITGTSVPLEQLSGKPGDVVRTAGDTSLARRTLGWSSTTQLSEGLVHQWEWHLERRQRGTG